MELVIRHRLFSPYAQNSSLWAMAVLLGLSESVLSSPVGLTSYQLKVGFSQTTYIPYISRRVPFSSHIGSVLQES